MLLEEREGQLVVQVRDVRLRIGGQGGAELGFVAARIARRVVHLTPQFVRAREQAGVAGAEFDRRLREGERVRENLHALGGEGHAEKRIGRPAAGELVGALILLQGVEVVVLLEQLPAFFELGVERRGAPGAPPGCGRRPPPAPAGTGPRAGRPPRLAFQNRNIGFITSFFH